MADRPKLPPCLRAGGDKQDSHSQMDICNASTNVYNEEKLNHETACEKLNGNDNFKRKSGQTMDNICGHPAAKRSKRSRITWL